MKKKALAVPAAPTFKTELEALAMMIAAELRMSATPLDERIGGFKALTAYYAMINKLPQPADDSKGAFDGWARRLKTDPTGRGNGVGRPGPESGEPNF